MPQARRKLFSVVTTSQSHGCRLHGYRLIFNHALPAHGALALATRTQKRRKAGTDAGTASARHGLNPGAGEEVRIMRIARTDEVTGGPIGLELLSYRPGDARFDSVNVEVGAGDDSDRGSQLFFFSADSDTVRS